MSVLETAKKRYAVRAYLPRPVEEEKLALILEAAHVAPTGANRQPQRIFVIRSEEGLAKLAKGARTYGAPMAILVCADVEESWLRPEDGKRLSDIDATIVTDHMMLAASELGLGSVWICHFDPEVIRREFALPDGVEPVNILTLGYADTAAESPKSPDRHSDPKVRKPLSETVTYC